MSTQNLFNPQEPKTMSCIPIPEQIEVNEDSHYLVQAAKRRRDDEINEITYINRNIGKSKWKIK